MQRPHTTRDAAKVLQVPFWRLHYLLQAEKIPSPEQDGSGNFWWTAADIENARSALAAPRKAVTA